MRTRKTGADNLELDPLPGTSSQIESSPPEEPDCEVETKTPTRKIPGLGLGLALLSAVCVSLSGLTIKLLPSLNPLSILLGRSLFQFSLSLPVVIHSKSSLLDHREERPFLLARCILGCIHASALYYAIRLLPLGDASTIVHSSPAFVSLFACLLLKEPCGVFNSVTVVFVLIGVLFVGKPSFIFGGTPYENQLAGTLVALASSVAIALVFICLRKLKRTPASMTITTFSLTVALECAIVLAILQNMSMPSCGYEAVLYLACGFFSCAGQFLITTAAKLEKAGPLAVVRTSNVVFAFLLQSSVLGVKPAWTSILGACIICLTVLMLAIRRWHKEKPDMFSWVKRREYFPCNCM